MKENTNPSDLTLIGVMKRFSTEEEARKYFEQVRWPHGPTCPHCGNVDTARIYAVTPNPEKKIRAGVWKCGECLKSFTVTVKTVMEDSHVPLNKWLIAFYMMCASKTQISALQLQRQLELGSYKTAWFMCQRIRFALAGNGPMGKLMGTVEADETYVGGKVRGRGRHYVGNKIAVVSLVERGGRVHSSVMKKVSGKALGKLMRQNIDALTHLNTDESKLYTKPGEEFLSHDTVNHGAEEYARHDEKTGRLATTNTVEGFFGNTKRSIDGTHHHVAGKHLNLYMAEVDHKYNTRGVSDGARTDLAIRTIEGRRLTYKTPIGGAS